MEIPYTVTARPDTGLYSAKIGIWLFLASEVMLFGGLFSSYVFLRMGSEPGLWPMGLLNVPIGTLNTAILILSSVTVVLAWASLKMRKFSQYKLYMAITIICGIIFLGIKLGYEYPAKFQHFGAFIKPEAVEKYERYLGNNHAQAKDLTPRYEISGHLEKETADQFVVILDPKNANPTDPYNDRPHFLPRPMPGKAQGKELAAATKAGDTIKATQIEEELLEKGQLAVIDKEDIRWASPWAPKHSSFFAIYFTITGLHGLHVLGGIIIFLYLLFPGAKLYKKNPEHLANRVEVAGLFWHFVDLVWIFAFPIFYLL